MKNRIFRVIITCLTVPLSTHAASQDDDALIAANCTESQDNATLRNVCNDVSWCENDSSSDGSKTPQAMSTSQKTKIYKDHRYCTRIPFKFDDQSYTYVLCFKDKNLCNQMHCKEGYIGTLPDISDTTLAYGMMSGVTDFNYETFYTVNVDSTSKQIFNCCSTIELDTYTSKPLPNSCYDAANYKVTWYLLNSCTDSGASTTTGQKSYLTCKTGYYTGNAAASSGKYTLDGANPCNYISSIGCTACPSASDIFSDQAMTTPVTGTTSGYGAAGVTSCYIPATSVGYFDTTGKFKAPSNCSYKR